MRSYNGITKKSGTVLLLHEETGQVHNLLHLFQSQGLNAVLHSCDKELHTSVTPDAATCLVACVNGSEKCGLGYYDGLKQSGFYVPVVFLMKNPNLRLAVRAMRAGAEDLIALPVDESQLMGAVFRALEKSKQFAARCADHLDIRKRAALLTIREREIVKGVIAGKLNKEIANDLGLALVTVKVHRGHAMHKLGARTPANLTRIAQLAGIVPDAGTVGIWPTTNGAPHNGSRNTQ